jgi:hypothetical protein
LIDKDNTAMGNDEFSTEIGGGASMDTLLTMIVSSLLRFPGFATDSRSRYLHGKKYQKPNSK